MSLSGKVEAEAWGTAGWAWGAELLLLLTHWRREISASQAEPYRHVRVMRVMGFAQRNGNAKPGMFWWES